MTTLRLTTIGDGLGLVLPPEVLERLQAFEGAEVQLIETPDGAIIQRVDADAAEQIEIAKGVMDRRRDALRRLAE